MRAPRMQVIPALSAALAAAALLVTTPGTAQDSGSLLDAMDEAIQAERTYCESLDLVPDDALQTTHSFARTSAQTGAAQAERKAAEAYELERRRYEDLTRRYRRLSDQRFDKYRAIDEDSRAKLSESQAKREELAGKAGEIDTQILSITVDISVLNAENQREGGLGWLSAKVRSNNQRIATLTAELTALQQQKSQIASENQRALRHEDEVQRDRETQVQRANAADAERLLDLGKARMASMEALRERQQAHARAAEAAL